MEKEQVKKFFEEIGLAKGIANIKKFEEDIMIPEIIKAKKEVFDDWIRRLTGQHKDGIFPLAGQDFRNKVIEFIEEEKRHLSILKKMKLSSIILLTLSLICSIMIGFLMGSLTNAEASNQDERLSFIKVAEHLADERGYNEHIYDCSEFSKELVRREKDIGYNARYVVGYLHTKNEVLTNTQDYNNTHAWVEVSVILESTNGIAVPVEDYYIYEEKE